MKTKPLAGKTITLPVFLRAEPLKSYGALYKEIDGFDVFVSASGSIREDDFLLAKTSVTFTVPDDFDVVGPMVASIEAKKAALAAEFSARVAELNKRLSELQAIEYDGASA